jgi:hypothetical protein
MRTGAHALLDSAPMPPIRDLPTAISTFGASAAAKLSQPAAKGEPEDQLRAPLETLLSDLAQLCGIPPSELAAVGESSVADLKTRPDYAIVRSRMLIGFLELKAPGKGADPRRFKDQHGKTQWAKLQALPNLIYTDGNAFSLWQGGELALPIVHLEGDVASSGSALKAPQALLDLFQTFFQWEPIPPRDAKQLADLTARLCRLLRDEVTEQLSLGSASLTALARDWRALLFPEASDAQFADGYAQAVTFGLLMARARGIELRQGLDQAAKHLGQTNSLIGTALRILTDDAANKRTLKTSIETLVRVLDAVHWPAISRGTPDAWLYFYEDFLAVYDNELRKSTGSYYTPPEVVRLMVRLVDEVLRDQLSLRGGLASPQVTLADPAVGTGTFLLEVLRRIEETVGADQGPGAVPASIDAAVRRLIAFEIQLGPFAVAQLRVLAELNDLIGAPPSVAPRMFVTDSLGNPYIEQERLGAIYDPIAQSRREANEIKRHERIMVVLGNPPYKEKAKGRGGWIESGSPNSREPAPLAAWLPPREWGVGAHSKHLRNLYVYFWRWATWKAFDQDAGANAGVVCFISVAGFLNGPGFEKMRDYLRRTTDSIWVIDCSPEGHQPEVATRIFEGVQQPVCVVLAVRSATTVTSVPAAVRFRSLPVGRRQLKFDAMRSIALNDGSWSLCSNEWRAPFLPESSGSWSTYPSLSDLFLYDGSGTMPGRTWIIAPDAESLRRRWKQLVNAPTEEKEVLFHAHYRKSREGKNGIGDRHPERAIKKGLPGYPDNPIPVARDKGDCLPPVRYGYRSFDRQWIIPDNRLINQPNPELWEAHSEHQVYLTALTRTSPTAGPAVTITGLLPDHDHYKGSFAGRAFPLWLDRQRKVPNFRPALLGALAEFYGVSVGAEDLFAYVAAIFAHPAYVDRFRTHLAQPGLRVPLTRESQLFSSAVELGRTVVWLHTFGERFADGKERKSQPPRLRADLSPRVPAGGAIPGASVSMPDSIDYDIGKRHLIIEGGYVENVSPEVWNYEVSGKQILRQWFSYRRAHRERPIIGDRRKPSVLGDVQPERWPAEYTTELLDVLHVLGRLVEIEPQQAALLEAICTGPLLSLVELGAMGALAIPEGHPQSPSEAAAQAVRTLFD